jgi:2-(1,2-epoxy-1,2-dihydrophenyl)acetyl-CoA isomerase
MTEHLKTAVKNGVLTITLDRPKANAFNLALVAELSAALKTARREDAVRAIVLTGSGEIFSAGQDVREFREVEGESLREHILRTYNPLVMQIRQLEKPILAAVNGAVAGAALGVVLACDLRIAVERATFFVGFLGIGLVPDSAVSLLLPLVIGLGRATEFAFTNRPISARQALEWGLVNRLVPAGELQSEAQKWAEELARGPITAMGLTKRSFNRAVLGNLAEVLDYEAHLQDIAGLGEEHKEGVRAFLEKRPSVFN